MKQFYHRVVLFILLCCSLFSMQNVNAQSWQWAKGATCNGSMSSTGSEGWLVKTDLSNNIFTAISNRSDSICLGSNKIYCPLYQNQTVIAKYDLLGNVLWAQYNSTGNASPIDITTDNDGNLYLLGYASSDSFKFGTSTIKRIYPAAYNYCFVIKFDTYGNIVWTTSGGAYWEGSFNASFGSITVDVFNNVYIAASYRDLTIQFGTYVLTNIGGVGTDDFFVVKYNSSGNVVWAKNFGGTGQDHVHGIIVGTDNKINLTGEFSSPSILFGSTTLNYTASYVAGTNNFNVYWAQLDASGNAIWAKQATGSNMVMSMAQDKLNNTYIGGVILDTIATFGSNTFLHKLSKIAGLSLLI